MRVMRAIFGEPTQFLAPPRGALEAALTAVKTLSDKVGDETLFGFVSGDPIQAQAYNDELTTTIRSGLTKSSHAISITWRYGILWESDDWWEAGWHPDSQILALRPETATRLYRALNGRK